jgi:hypothetical protein
MLPSYPIQSVHPSEAYTKAVELDSAMIRTEEMIPMLLDACPGFRPRWEQHIAYWEGEAAGLYVDLSQFVDYLMAAYEQGETTTLESAFDLLERFLVDGGSSVQEHAALGIIETLQNAAGHQQYTEKVFVPFLKTQSLREWKAIEQGWEDLMRRHQRG